MGHVWAKEIVCNDTVTGNRQKLAAVISKLCADFADDSDPVILKMLSSGKLTLVVTSDQPTAITSAPTPGAG